MLTYLAEPLYTAHLDTLHLRSVSMDTSQHFEPSVYDEADAVALHLISSNDGLASWRELNPDVS